MTPSSEIVITGTPSDDATQVLRLDSQGFHYNDQFIPDAGQAHTCFLTFIRDHSSPSPRIPTPTELDTLMHDFVLGGESPADCSFDHRGYAYAVLRLALRPLPPEATQ
jgi:hypothetical protein